MRIFNYNRESAVRYAHSFAEKRNSRYYDFTNIGGDCTNFASQCVFAGSGVMDYRYPLGWFYRNANDKAPAWTGVTQFYNYMTRTKETVGPFGHECNISEIEIGDVAQLKFEGMSNFSHTPVIVAILGEKSLSNILVAAHTNDSDNRPLDSYEFEAVRFIHIDGVRNY